MTTFDFRLSESGDLDLDTSGTPYVVQGEDAVIQIVRQHLKLWVGNWFRNTDYGTDWASILKKSVRTDFISQVIAQSILQLDFVTDVVDVFVNLNKTTRQAQITYVLIANGEEYTSTEDL